MHQRAQTKSVCQQNFKLFKRFGLFNIYLTSVIFGSFSRNWYRDIKLHCFTRKSYMPTHERWQFKKKSDCRRLSTNRFSELALFSPIPIHMWYSVERKHTLVSMNQKQ